MPAPKWLRYGLHFEQQQPDRCFRVRSTARVSRLLDALEASHRPVRNADNPAQHSDVLLPLRQLLADSGRRARLHYLDL